MGQFTIQYKKCRKYAGHMEDVGKKLQKLEKQLKDVSTALHSMGGYGDIEAALTGITERVGGEEKSAKDLGKALENITTWYEETENKLVPPKEENTVGEWIHTGLDVAGLIPGWGAIADGINVAYYLGERRFGEAALSAVSFLPVIGEFSGGGKVAVKAVSHADDVGKAVKGGGKAAEKVLKVVKDNAKKVIKNQADNAVKYIDDVIDGGKAVDDVVDASKYVDDVIKGGTDASDIRNINGQRTSRYRQLSDDEISQLLDDIEALEADSSIFRFNEGNQTGFLDSEGIINVRGDVLPDLNSNHPRDLMSPRAVLAHEYYGHKHFDDVFGVRNPLPGSWNDEFRASYNAALNAPNLSDMDRMYLMLDALERAKEAGVNITIIDEIRRILYGY